jgi:hypothetical protein
VTGEGQYYKVDCPEVPSEMTATILVSNTSRLQFFRRLTHFECFGSRRSRVLLLHSSFFCLQSEMVHTCLFACHSGCHELVSLPVKQSKMWRKRSQSSDFLCAPITNLGSNCHTLCGVFTLTGHCCVQFRIQCCDSSVPLLLLLPHYCTCARSTDCHGYFIIF